jgi:hypothetical protein
VQEESTGADADALLDVIERGFDSAGGWTIVPLTAGFNTGAEPLNQLRVLCFGAFYSTLGCLMLVWVLDRLQAWHTAADRRSRRTEHPGCLTFRNVLSFSVEHTWRAGGCHGGKPLDLPH